MADACLFICELNTLYFTYRKGQDIIMAAASENKWSIRKWDAFLREFGNAPCGSEEQWSLSVAVKTLGDGFHVLENDNDIWVTAEDIIPELLKDIIDYFNEQTTNSIMMKLEAQFLKRAEGGICFVGKDKYVWPESERYGYDQNHYYDDDHRVLAYADLRPKTLFPIGDGGVITFVASHNCPKMAMMILHRYFNETPGYKIVNVKGYPDDDSMLWGANRLWY